MKSLINVAFFVSSSEAVIRPYVRLTDNLDEQDDLGFCIDMEGWGPTVEFEDLQTHSCKPNDTADESFSIEDGAIVGYGDATGRCLEVQSN